MSIADRAAPTLPDPALEGNAGIASRLAAVRAEIARAAAASGRDPASVTLIAVGKTHDTAAIEAAIAAGQTVFGENRVQEAAGKYPSFKARHPNLELHLIGPLQTNKVRDAVALFDVIETIDRPRLAEKLAEEIKRTGRHPSLYIQVNIGAEPQKAGVSVADLEILLARCRALELPIAGLMCIPPADRDPASHFAALAELARRYGLASLSMGMSGDFQAAIAAGATHVRVGTAIFGSRPQSKIILS